MRINVIFISLLVIYVTILSCKKEVPREEITPKVEAEVAVMPYDAEAEKAAEALKEKAAKAKAMVQLALNYMEKYGREKTFDAIDNPRNRDHRKFVDGDFYIWVFQTDYVNRAVVVAHAINPTLRGKEWFDTKDPDGKLFFHDIVRIAKHKEDGWVLYRWAHPKYKKAMPKVTYFKKSGDLIFQNGFYIE